MFPAVPEGDGTRYIELRQSFDAVGRDVTILYNSMLLVTLITPVGEIVIPTPAVSLSYFPSKAVLILYTVVFKVLISAALVPTTPIVVLKTLSRVVIPSDDSPGRFEVFTTTASAKVIGTNSVFD
jgi:hypothetical protein|nr:MAG TPA: hypothetical protein [Caudoviricetes sp.]